MQTKHRKYKDYVEIRQGPWSGYVHIDFQDIPVAVLVNPAAMDNRRGSFEKVRSSDTAEVYRYTIDFSTHSEWFYLKKFPHRSLADLVKQILCPSRAKKAFQAACMLEKLRFETPQVVALLQHKEGAGSHEDILITRGVANTTALSDALALSVAQREPASLKSRRTMIAEFGQIIARMHAAGICHGDLRTGNVLVKTESGDRRFIFIDNERTQQYPVLPLWLRKKNLVQLNMTHDIVTHADRLRFLKSYCETSGMELNRLARRVMKRTVTRLKKRSRTHIGFADKDLRSHWDYRGAQASDYSGYFLADFCHGDKAASFLPQIESLTESGSVLKDDIATRVVRCTCNNRDIVIKRYNHQGLWHSLRHTIKGSRAMKCWRFGHQLTALNIPCAMPIGVIEQRKYGLIWQSYILNDFVEGPNIQDYIHQPNLPENKKRKILAKALALASQLAKTRLIHNDLKPCNLLINNEEVFLIDLDSMQRHGNRWILSLYKRKMDNKIRERIFNG